MRTRSVSNEKAVLHARINEGKHARKEDIDMSASLRWRLALFALLSVPFAYALLVSLVHVRESLVRSRSETLYAQFLKLRPGETTKADIDALRRRFAGSVTENVDCGRTECEYTIGQVWGYSRWFRLTRLAHDHMPSSQLSLKTSGNVLSGASFYVGVVVPKGYRRVATVSFPATMRVPPVPSLWGPGITDGSVPIHALKR